MPWKYDPELGLFFAPPAGAGAGDGYNIISAGTQQAGTAATVRFADSNGITFGMSNSSVVTASYTQSTHSHSAETFIGGIQGSGASVATSGTVQFANSNGITFGLNGQTITAAHNGLTTAALSNHSHGNPTLALTNLSGTTASASDGFTLSLSAGAGGAGDGYNIIAAGSQTAGTTGTIKFADSNGITFGMSLSTQITAAHNGLTTAANSTHTHGNPSITGPVSITSQSNAWSFSISNYITTARASNDALGLNTAQSNVTWTANSGGLSLDARGYAGTGTSATNATVTLNSLGLQIQVAAPGAGAAPQGSFFQNLSPWASSAGMAIQSSSHNSLMIFPLNPQGGMPFDITANTFVMKASISGSTATLSASHNTSFDVGVYTMDANGTLRLINSVRSAWGLAAVTNNSTYYQGRRAITIHSSQWSSQPVFKAGSNYYIGVKLSSSSRAAQTWAWEGQYLFSTAAHSGTVGVNSTNNTWMKHIPGHGIYSSNTTGYTSFSNLQSIANSQILQNATAAHFLPLVILNNQYGTF